MAGFPKYLSILTLKVSGLNFPIKRHHLTNWIRTEETICCLQDTHFADRNKHWLKVKGWKKIYQANGPSKQVGVTILISNKEDFKFTLVEKDKGHFILMKGAIYQEITIKNIYAPMSVHPTSLNIH
jgi:exonuclease III